MASCRVPLDEQQVTEAFGAQGRERTLPALHPERKEDRGFLPYKPPPEGNFPAQMEEFLEHSQFIMEDLEWLLNLPHDKFWCQVVFDESLQGCLDSYLRLAPRGIDDSCLSLSPAVADVQRRLHRSVFMVFLRMATHRESKENFFTPAVFGEIIYDNFLFDIPKLLDLCVLYGRGNSQLLHKMMENIFKQQPSYYGDLNEIVPSIIQVFNTILEKCGLQSDESTSNEPLKLNAHTRITAMTMREEDFSELLSYLCDTCTTIHAFIDIFPEASNTFHRHGFLNRLSSFYELAVPDMERAVRKRSFHTCVQEDLWRRLSHSSRRIVEIAHTLLQHTCLQPILEGSDNTVAYVEDFLQTFTTFLQDKRFLADYDEVYPVAEDISLLQQAFPHLDDTRTSYLLEGVHSAWESTGKKRSQPLSASHGSEISSKTPHDLGPSHLGADEREELREAASTMAVAPNGANGAVCTVSSGAMESLLSHIRDLLPDLGEGFLMSCLEVYGYDSELVINNILEDRLTPELSKLDRNLPRPVKEAQASVLSSRSNAFDDDEFDVFSRDKVDVSRIWRGRRQGESVRHMLNDKRHVNENRERYRSYQTVVDEVPITTDPSGIQGSDYIVDEYDDEYDDTYSTNQVGANDLDEDDELLNRRPFTTPRVLRAGRTEDEDDGEQEDEEEKEDAVKRDHFVQDPAVLRERAEARRAAMQNKRGYRPPPPSNVVGGPKGRGQTQETIQDRRRKEMNKSRGANHNRRTMADRKRNKGMIPS